jgi:hypothetical protein
LMEIRIHLYAGGWRGKRDPPPHPTLPSPRLHPLPPPRYTLPHPSLTLQVSPNLSHDLLMIGAERQAGMRQ